MAEILHNSKARRDYHILETFEAGLVLHGSEVKALRAGHAQIGDAFARAALWRAGLDYDHGTGHGVGSYL